MTPAAVPRRRPAARRRVRARRRRGPARGAGASGSASASDVQVADGLGGLLSTARSSTVVPDGLRLEVRSALDRAPGPPAARRRAGAAQGRARRARGRGDDRTRGRRDRAVGGVALDHAVARPPRREGAGQVAPHRPRGGQAEPPAARADRPRPGHHRAGGRARRGRASCCTRTPSCRWPAPRCPRAGELVLVVGPEGGIAPEELAAFTAAGATPVRLGSEVLRTSTAGAAALAVLSVRLGRWA